MIDNNKLEETIKYILNLDRNNSYYDQRLIRNAIIGDSDIFCDRNTYIQFLITNNANFKIKNYRRILYSIVIGNADLNDKVNMIKCFITGYCNWCISKEEIEDLTKMLVKMYIDIFSECINISDLNLFIEILEKDTVMKKYNILNNKTFIEDILFSIIVKNKIDFLSHLINTYSIKIPIDIYNDAKEFYYEDNIYDEISKIIESNLI
jgi:hypothetical protein